MIDAPAIGVYIYTPFNTCMCSLCIAVVKMKIQRARFQMTTIVQDSRFNPVEALELFSKIPFVAIPQEHEKSGPSSEDMHDEKMDDKKKKQRKKRILTGVSRQRRAANDRERRRNERLNQAFVTLKRTLPLANIDISKIEILRLAVKWIDHLATLLKDNEQQRGMLAFRQMQPDQKVVSDQTTEKPKPVRHDCLYHQDPDLKNTLWEDCIGLPSKSSKMVLH